jgi:oligopeptide transport system substrate-binding protein
MEPQSLMKSRSPMKSQSPMKAPIPTPTPARKPSAYRGLLAIALVALTPLSGCTKSKNDESRAAPAVLASPTAEPLESSPAVHVPPHPLQTFTFRLPGDPETLDWNRAHTSVETWLLTNLMEGLVTHDEKMGVVPALAESWTKSADGKTYTFKIRKGVKWSDGVPLKAADFLYSWKRLLSPVTAAAYAYILFDVDGAEDFYKGKLTDFSKVGISAPDDSTLVVKLAKPVAHFIHIPTFWVTFPLREDVVEKYGTAWPKPGRMVTLGPYELSSYDLDSKIVLTANPYYYGPHGNVDQAVGVIVKEDSTALTLYETGKIDFLTDISSTDLKRLEGRPDLEKFPYLKTVYLGFVVDQYPISSVHLRRAMAMAIDKTKFGEFLHGGQVATGSFIPDGMFGYNKSIGLRYDPAAAKKELAKSGVKPGMKIELVTPNWEKNLTVCQFIQAELKKNLGLEISIRSFDHKTFRAQLELYSFPIFLNSWSADYPDPDNFLSVFLGGAGNNRTKWKNSEYDAKVLLARYNQNENAREKLYDQAQKILVEDEMPILPLYNEPILALVNPRVKNLKINALNYIEMKAITLATPEARPQ